MVVADFTFGHETRAPGLGAWPPSSVFQGTDNELTRIRWTLGGTMARPPHPGPTERELTLFKILWNLGPSTVRRIREAFPAQRRPAHTSVQTNLQLDFGH